MDRPEELEFRGLLFGGILIMLVLAVSLVVFFVIYQKKLIAQQLHMQQIQSNYQRQMLASSVEAQEKERQRIGHDLHDQIGSSLSTVKLLLNQVGMQQQNEEAQHLIANIKEILSNTVQDVRNISHDLYPSVLAKFGLADALQNLAYVLSEASELEIDFTTDEIAAIPQQQELALYRMVQELSNNTLKHANATQFDISLKQTNNAIHLVVQDNGVGFDYEAISENRNAGIGLKSIQARASMIGAGMQVTTQKDKGTRVEISLPLQHSI